MVKANFIEAKNLSEANEVDLDNYVFLERMSSKMGAYVFKVRERKRNE
jgi:hypothetical protein